MALAVWLPRSYWLVSGWKSLALNAALAAAARRAYSAASASGRFRMRAIRSITVRISYQVAVAVTDRVVSWETPGGLGPMSYQSPSPKLRRPSFSLPSR